jgi:hypothetical protein
MTHDSDDELRHAQAAALEQETRALNCERALEHAQDEVATLRARVAELDDDLRRTKLDAYHAAQHDGCVTLVELRELLTRCEEVYAGGGAGAGSDALDVIAFFLVERSGAAQAAEAGETGEG